MPIIRIKKSTLEIDGDWADSGSTDFLSSPDTFSIDHFSGATSSSSDTLSFSLKPASSQVPVVNELDFVNVVRKKIDVTSAGPDKQSSTDADNDVGEHDHKDGLPRQRKQLPLGMNEIKGSEL